ncbi:adenylyltransferase/cytidyltransferase family protein [Patescibacteria group bacterium]|nr:adenylyltransferase/cytidyltransferase family protein [Patescibacteria group bacterium]
MSQKTKVMIFGTFDNLHAGHEFFIKEAKKLGDQVIAVVARDLTVKQIKKKEPEISEKKRLNALKNHPLIDKAILGEKSDKFKVILKHKPDILALGYDQFVFTFLLPKFLIKNKLNIEIKRIDPYNPQIFKSSVLRAKKEQNA